MGKNFIRRVYQINKICQLFAFIEMAANVMMIDFVKSVLHLVKSVRKMLLKCIRKLSGLSYDSIAAILP